MIEKVNHALAYPEGEGYGGSTPIESSKNFVLCVCKIYCPSTALVFIKSKILYNKTLEIVC